MTTTSPFKIQAELERIDGTEAASRFDDIAAAGRVDMAAFSVMEPHQARSLLPREIWRGRFREGTLTILGGESKARKSWFSLAFAMAAVTDGEFLDSAIVPPLDTPRRARVLDFELLEGNVMSRFLAMSEKYMDAAQHLAIWSRVEIFTHRERMTETTDWIAYACHHCAAMNRGDVLIVDCLQALDAGDANDPAAVRRALSRLQAVATKTGVFVLIVDHFNKSTEARGKNRLSGSMAKAATPDAIVLLESDGPFIKLSFDLRMDPPIAPLSLTFDSPSEGFRVVSDDERDERKAAGREARDEERLAAMFPERGRQYTKAQIAANIGKSQDTAQNWLRALEDRITTYTQGGQKPNLYSLR